MIVLGLDPSTKLGVTAINSTPEAVTTYHVETINTVKDRGITRLEKIHNHTKRVVNKLEPVIIVIEGYGFASQRGVTLGEIGAMVRFACARRAVVLEVAPKAVKRFAASNGNANKDKMMLEIFKRWGFEGSDDECDAYALARFGSCLLGHTDVPKANYEPVEKWINAHPKTYQKILKLIE